MGLQQQPAKRQIIATFDTSEEAAQAAEKWPSKKGVPRSCILHLGQILHPSGSTRFEVDARLDAARKAWLSLRGLWTARDVHLKYEARVYTAVVFSTLTSGLVALVLDGPDLRRLEVAHAR